MYIPPEFVGVEGEEAEDERGRECLLLDGTLDLGMNSLYTPGVTMVSPSH